MMYEDLELELFLLDATARLSLLAIAVCYYFAVSIELMLVIQPDYTILTFFKW